MKRLITFFSIMLIFSMSYAQTLPFPSNQQRQISAEPTIKTNDTRLKEQISVSPSERNNPFNLRSRGSMPGLSPLSTTYLPLADTKDAKSGTATVVLVAGDIWGDGTGYQMLLDADATAYGTIISNSSHLSPNGNAPAGVYEAFEFKIPTNADGILNTSNIVLNDSIAITIPGGVYDCCIVNPVPERNMIYTVDMRNNYYFQAGCTYIFKVLPTQTSDEVVLTVIVPPTLPQEVSNFMATPDANEALTCELTWVNPSLTLGGTALPSIDSVVIMRNGVVIHTVNNPVVGANGSWTDNVPNNGFYNYSIYVVNSVGSSSIISLNSVVVGPHPCSIAINTFPWSENFENSETLICWDMEYVQGNAKWLTGTSTGSNGITAYLYNTSATTAVTKYITPKLDITSLDVPLLQFTHLQSEYLSTQDELRLYYKTSDTGTWNLLKAWTNNIPTWTEEFVHLPNGSNDYYLAFEGTATLGAGVGIDNVVIKGLSGVDVAVIGLTSPQSGANLTHSETVTVNLKNYGADTIQSLELKLFVNDTLIATETAAITIVSLGSATYTFTTKADLSVVQTHNIKIVANLLNDTDSNNDTLIHKVVNYGNMVIMGTAPSVTTCGATFVDDGIDGNYLANSGMEQMITFFPANAGDKVRMTINEFKTVYNEMFGYDALYIFSGHFTNVADANPENILNGYAGDMTAVLPVSLTSTSVDGALTIVFIKNNYFGSVASGWNATISCITPPDNDAALLAVTSPLSGGATAATVSVAVKNFGTIPITGMDIYYQVNNGTPVKETFTGNIASYVKDTFNFTQTVDLSVYQDYEIVVYAELANDNNASNDTARISFSYQPPVTLYGYLIFDDKIESQSFVSFNSNNPGNITLLKDYADAGYPIYSGAYSYGQLYGFTRASSTPRNFVKFDASWNMLSSQPVSIPTSDATFDYSSNSLLAIVYNATSEKSDLYRVDVNTGVATRLVGLDQNYLVIACDYHGILYGISRVSAELFRINKSTGISTLIGATGVETPNYVQSMTFDHASGRLFWALMTNTAGRLVELNITTGKATDLGKIGNNSEIVMLYTPVDGTGITTFESANINMYPNPATDQITIEGTQGATVNIYDITGKILLTNIMHSDRETINVSQLSAGVYIVELQNQKSKSTSKLIKR